MEQMKQIVARYTCDGTAIQKLFNPYNPLTKKKNNQRMEQITRIVARYTCDGTAIQKLFNPYIPLTKKKTING